MRFAGCLFNKLVKAVNESAVRSHLYRKILEHFPNNDNISLAFAYGSAAFPQKGHSDPSSNMLDFVFVVRNPREWHAENLLLNPAHYSSAMRYLGADKIVKFQDNYGASVFYNTLIKCEDRMIKYGVISLKNLESDLLNWDNLYIAGRLHKPVHIVRHNFEHNPNLMLAMRTNLHSALYTSFLMLPEVFSEKELYLMVAGLSYSGDFRMIFGEDKNKVSNIVEKNFEKFQDLYHPILESITSNDDKYILWDKNEGIFEIDNSPNSRHMILHKLPLRLQIRMVREFDKNALQIRDTEEILRNIARYADIDQAVRDATIYTVKRASRSQSLKSLFGVGLVKSIQYGREKISKMRKGKKSKPDE